MDAWNDFNDEKKISEQRSLFVSFLSDYQKSQSEKTHKNYIFHICMGHVHIYIHIYGTKIEKRLLLNALWMVDESV